MTLLVITNTNLAHIDIKDALNSSLVHPTDIKKILSVEEEGERHIVIFFHNTIVAPVIKLINRQKRGSENRFFEKIYLLKEIGSFSKLPYVRTSIDATKTGYKSQLGVTHVKTLPEAINYSFDFSNSPMDSPSDIKLLQDIFSRLSDFNEFVVWVNGGNENLNRKFDAPKGWRFKDLVKSLTSNNLSLEYKDGRVSSGVSCIIECRQVP